MKLIGLTKGQVAKVDDADFDWLSQWKWYAQRCSNGFYAARRECRNGPLVYMHRLINQTPRHLVTDHIDNDGLNNQRDNLRDASVAQNQMNARAKSGTADLKGAWRDSSLKTRKMWRSSIKVAGKRVNLGRFETAEEAAAAYSKAAKQYFGDFAYSNGENP